MSSTLCPCTKSFTTRTAHRGFISRTRDAIASHLNVPTVRVVASTCLLAFVAGRSIHQRERADARARECLHRPRPAPAETDDEDVRALEGGETISPYRRAVPSNANDDDDDGPSEHAGLALVLALDARARDRTTTTTSARRVVSSGRSTPVARTSTRMRGVE